MYVDVWFFAVLAVVLAAAGFWAGRVTSPDRREVEVLRRRLDSTQAELQKVREQVNGHFRQSARLFGSLAQDYRALYEHFSETAQELGFTENETRVLLEPADQHLLGANRSHDPEPEGSPPPETETVDTADDEPEPVLKSRQAEG